MTNAKLKIIFEKAIGIYVKLLTVVPGTGKNKPALRVGAAPACKEGLCVYFILMRSSSSTGMLWLL